MSEPAGIGRNLTSAHDHGLAQLLETPSPTSVSPPCSPPHLMVLVCCVSVHPLFSGKPEGLRTLNLLPGVAASPGGGDDAPAANRHAVSDHPVELFPRHPAVPDLNRKQNTAPMTIFFGGKVVVFNNFPADKAKELMDMAGTACPAPAQSSRVEQPVPAPVAPPQHHPAVAAAAAAAAVSVPTSETKPTVSAAAVAAAAVNAAATPAVAKQEEAPSKPPPPAASDLPIARRVSLHRFLEKRKDRITAKAPYQVNPSSGAPGSSPSHPAKGEEKGREWLGLAPQASKPEGDSAGGWRRPAKAAANADSDCS